LRPPDESGALGPGVLEALIAASLDAVVVFDHDRRIVTFNAGAEQLFERSAAAVIGTRVDTLLLDDIAEHQITERLALSGLRSGGAVFPVDGSITTVRVREATLGMLVLRDATASRLTEKLLRESDERFRVAFTGSPIGFALTDPDGRMRAVNRSLCDMLGYTPEELQAMRYQDITHSDDLGLDVESATRLLAGEIDHYRLEKRFVHKQGHAVWALLAVSLVRDGAREPLLFVAQATDITSLKEAERSLVSQAAELKRSNADLEELAYVASHDLQEPLRVVGTYVDLLAERYKGSLDETADRWIGYVTNGIDRMKWMIDALLALARVSTDGEGFAQVAFPKIVERVWQQLLDGQIASSAELTCGSLPTLLANEGQIHQLFQNLLGNAFKYSRQGVPLRVRVSAERRNDAPPAWEFALQDNGIGLDMAYAERIFQIFQRLHRGDEIEGTGMGLAICQRIVERHGGRIWVESILGEGATFRFTIAEQAQR
jgi:PAS domain S-box-containing protein